MPTPDLHPVARELLDAYASLPYFQSKRLTLEIAEREPSRCVIWALGLLEPTVLSSTPPNTVVDTLGKIRNSLGSPSQDALPELDELSWRCWCYGSFDDSSPYLQRAVARLGWATMLLVCRKTDTNFESRLTGIHNLVTSNGLLREMANQCAMAIDIVYAHTDDGRLMVASAFTREMYSES